MSDARPRNSGGCHFGSLELWTLLASLTFCACADGPELETNPSSACAGDGIEGKQAQPLFNAGRSATYLALTDTEQTAIGRLTSADTLGVVCTATQVSADWALTARHCHLHEKMRFLTGKANQREVVDWVTHPELDVALVRLSPNPCATKNVLPIAELEAEVELSRATLAGYGLAADNSIGELGFLTESVVLHDDTRVQVEGFGRSGACVGDSGGPLLIRDRHGRAALLGVLSAGASTCVGRDIYLRADSLLGWIQTYVELPAFNGDCGAIDEQGRCFDGQAVWCADGSLVAETCEGDTTCGYEELANGYRCSTTPRCAGDAFGSCSGSVASHCSPEGPTSETCSDAGLTCAYAPVTGSASCMPAPP